MNLRKPLRKPLKGFRGEIKFREPLSLHTSFKIGGKVWMWAEPQDCPSLRQLISLARKKRIPVLIVGAGSNLLVKDEPLNAIAINLKGANFSRIRINSKGVLAGAGVEIGYLIKRCLLAGFGDLEFLVGIPASLGGAISMNARTFTTGKKSSMADIINYVKVMTSDGKIQKIKRGDLQFGYRSSNLHKCIILEAQLNLRKRSRKRIKELLNKNLRRRKSFQDLSAPSAGCVFRNPEREVASGKTCGYLIEKVKLKGKRIGDAEISRLHANFIINKGKAKAKDVIKLMRLIKAKIKEKFAITLEPEIHIVGRCSAYQSSRRKFRFL